jgi:AcrR family transcriptional regulator
MTRSVASDYEIQQQQILALAADWFARVGYPCTSMMDLAAASGASKARIYHYYSSKDAILFDLLDRYTERLVEIVNQVELDGEARGLNAHNTLSALIRSLLAEYETSNSRHVVLVNDLKYLSDPQRTTIVERQRYIVAVFRRRLVMAYPERMSGDNQTPITIMLFGMVNWTFTWLRSDGHFRYSDVAELVISLLDRGLG